MNDFQERMSKLTPRERQVCEVIKKYPELTVNGISRQVGLKRSATKFHLYNTYGKLGVNSRAELYAALREGKA